MPAEVLTYAVRRSARARRARLTVTAEGRVVVVLPQRAPLGTAALLVHEHADWVQRHLIRARAQQARLDARPDLAAGRVLSVNGIPEEPVTIWGRQMDNVASCYAVICALYWRNFQGVLRSPCLA